MTLRQHVVTVDGLEAKDVALASLRDLTDWLAEGVDRSMRLRIEGRSGARGRAPSWLTASRDVRVRDLRLGSLELVLAAPTLGESNPEMFGQGDLYGDAPGPDETPVDVFVDGLRDAIQGNRDSSRLDLGLLQSIASAEQLFSRGVRSIAFDDPRGPGRALVFRGEHIAGLRTLAESAPESKVARVVGVLDLLRASTGAFWLSVGDSGALRGLFREIDIDKSRQLLGELVVVEGVVTFRPSGAPLRIDATALRRAETADRAFARLPRATVSRQATLPAPGGIAEIFGAWPGDESDDQVEEALRELS